MMLIVVGLWFAGVMVAAPEAAPAAQPGQTRPPAGTDISIGAESRALGDSAGVNGSPTVGSSTLVSGAIELGIAGELATIEGIQTGSIRVHGGMFRRLWMGMASAELGFGYAHVSDLDQFDLESVLTWGIRWANTGSHPFVSIGGGWRHQAIGSFGQSRYPVGFGVGVRSLLGRLAGFRFEYRFRRVLNDPVSDFSEHRFTIGLSIFLRNSLKTKPGDK